MRFVCLVFFIAQPNWSTDKVSPLCSASISFIVVASSFVRTKKSKEELSINYAFLHFFWCSHSTRTMSFLPYYGPSSLSISTPNPESRFDHIPYFITILFCFWHLPCLLERTPEHPTLVSLLM